MRRRRKSSPSKPIPGKIRKYLLPKPDEFRAVAKAFRKSEKISAEDFFIISMIIDELEKTAETIKSGDKYWRALLDWAMGVVKFQRKVGIRRLQKIFAMITEVYESGENNT